VTRKTCDHVKEGGQSKLSFPGREKSLCKGSMAGSRANAAHQSSKKGLTEAGETADELGWPSRVLS
jgi:hypothetical protein